MFKYHNRLPVFQIIQTVIRVLSSYYLRFNILKIKLVPKSKNDVQNVDFEEIPISS